MRLGRLAALALTAVACGPTVVVGSSWNAETAIYGTYEHFGPPSFICGVAYDLHFRGHMPLRSLDVAVRFPGAFVALAADQSFVKPDWNRPIMQSIDGHSLTDEATRSGHAAGTVGGICPNGAAGLASLKGTIVRIAWRDDAGDHVEDVSVGRVRNFREFGGDASTDYQPRFEWRP